MEWARILAYITGTVDQELLLWKALIEMSRAKPMRSRERQGGLLRYYHREAA